VVAAADPATSVWRDEHVPSVKHWSPPARGSPCPAETAQRTDLLASAATDVRDQLHLASMQLAIDPIVNRAKAFLYRHRRVRLMALTESARNNSCSPPTENGSPEPSALPR
jgi:hypothetical protein